MEIKLHAGRKYSLCSCGLSKDLPYCDNAHREYNSKNNTNYKSVKVVPSSDTVINVTSSTWPNLECDIK